MDLSLTKPNSAIKDCIRSGRKTTDAKKSLSSQVHPSVEYALFHEEKFSERIRVYALLEALNKVLVRRVTI